MKVRLVQKQHPAAAEERVVKAIIRRICRSPEEVRRAGGIADAEVGRPSPSTRSRPCGPKTVICLRLMLQGEVDQLRHSAYWSGCRALRVRRTESRSSFGSNRATSLRDRVDKRREAAWGAGDGAIIGREMDDVRDGTQVENLRPRGRGSHVLAASLHVWRDFQSA